MQEVLTNDEVLSSTEKMKKMFTMLASMEASIGLIAYELWYNEVQHRKSVFHCARSLVCYRPYRESMCRWYGLERRLIWLAMRRYTRKDPRRRMPKLSS